MKTGIDPSSQIRLSSQNEKPDTSNRRSIAIINKQAGGGRAANQVDSILREVKSAWPELTLRFTEKPAHATDIAGEAVRSGYNTVLALGGDGTTFEVINGLLSSSGTDDTRLGVIPLGTGNSMLRDFDLESPAQAVQAILRNETRYCDVVRATHRDGQFYYVNLLSVGLSADAGDLTNKRYKKLGQLGYFFAVLACLAKQTPTTYPIKTGISGETKKYGEEPSVLLSFCNSRFTGGKMMMAPDASLSDGKLDVIRVGNLSPWKVLRNFPRIYRGTHIGREGIESLQTESIQFLNPKKTPMMVDGEIIVAELQKLEVLPNALQVFA